MLASRPKFILDTLVGPIYRFAFNNPSTTPLFWGLVFHILRPVSTWILCLICTVFAILPVFLHFWRTSQARPIDDWASRIVLITGGSHGMGKLLAQDIATTFRPKKVVLLDRNPVENTDERICSYQCDISDKYAVKELALTIGREIGYPTVLINNAGIVNSGTHLIDTDDALIERTMSVNFLGQVWVTKAFLPHMLAQNKGHLVTMSSVVGHSGASGAAAYCASKSALNGFLEVLRQELSGTNLRMTNVYPGLVATGMFAGVDENHGIPWLTPVLHPQEVVDAIIDALKKAQNSEIYLPLYTNAAPLFRFLPQELGDFIRWVRVDHVRCSWQLWQCLYLSFHVGCRLRGRITRWGN
ncbi:uncharacterized protein EV422DRAFT_491197 [Fimicolochytrium jonesii]|uniref:uncharacterized protein n=1 Tax=Fimicolochytrium jonesii TaxID=1396493 RepID=UPI0022FEC3E6|nr:uncharacterized protein EV422DRAFT_491197 [Fimicolochytrium jonesii]KAI8826804.1 hypothetical protein EV422DRAFT_491197 [Fimicolochytrium jonesii]